MPTINLIEEQRLIARKAEQQNRVLVMAALAIGAFSILGAGVCGFIAADAHLEANEIQRRLNALKPTLEEAERNEKEIEILKPRLATLESAKTNTDRWIRLLDHFATNTPDGVWLSGLTSAQTDKTKPVVVQVTGLGAGQESVGGFLLRMQSCEDLQKVNLTFTQEREMDNRYATEFEIKAEVAGTAAALPKDTKKDEDKA